MLISKKGASIISLTLCALAITLVTTALVVATNNSAMYRAEQIAKDEVRVVESSAYSKIYTIDEVEQLAKQAFANNYLAFYDKEVDLLGFEALIIGEMMQTLSDEELEQYDVFVTEDSVWVEYK